MVVVAICIGTSLTNILSFVLSWCCFRFDQTSADTNTEAVLTTGISSASPNSLGTSPVSGFVEIEPTTLLPRSQPIPAEHAATTRPWIEVTTIVCCIGDACTI